MSAAEVPVTAMGKEVFITPPALTATALPSIGSEGEEQMATSVKEEDIPPVFPIATASAPTFPAVKAS